MSMKKTTHWLSVLLVAGWLFLMIFLQHQDFFVKADWLLEDFLWKARWEWVGDKAPCKVSVVLITRQDVEKLHNGHFQWPLDRSWIGKLLEELKKSGARAVGFDMMFAADVKTPGDATVETALASWPGRVVFGTELTGQIVSLNDDDDSYGLGGGLIGPSRIIPEFMKHAWGMGAFNFLQIASGSEIPRENPLFFKTSGQYFPGLALATYLAGNSLKPDAILPTPGGLNVGSLRQIPSRPIASGTGTFWADRVMTPVFPRDWQKRFGCDLIKFSAMVMNPDVGQMVKERREKIQDSYVLVGVGDDFLGDTIQFPNQPNRIPGVLVHATLLDSLTRPEGFMTRLTDPSWYALTDAVALLLSLLIIVIQRRLQPFQGLQALLAIFSIFLSLVIVGFFGGYIVSWAVVPFSFFGSLIITYYYAFALEDQERKHIKEMFGKQVSPEVVEELLAKRDEILVARRQEISVAFLDVCGFTTFSEKHSPERVLIQLNHYFSHFIPEIMKNRGTLDKFIGDALMITTGVPITDAEHAYRMVEICRIIRRRITEINKNLPAGFEAFTLSCGVNSGDVIVGNVGSKERMEYTVIGDTVNLAARLQSASKSQEIVVGPRTYELTKDRFTFEPMAPLHVKGKSETIQAYKVLDT